MSGHPGPPPLYPPLTMHCFLMVESPEVEARCEVEEEDPEEEAWCKVKEGPEV